MVQAVCLALFLVLLFSRLGADGEGLGALGRGGEFFLILDPLVSITAAVASRALIWSLPAAAGVLVLGLFLPRFFCGYICPMGASIDLADWITSSRRRPEASERKGSRWYHLKYYILAVVFVAALFGVLVSGLVAALPLVTRGYGYFLGTAEMAFRDGWQAVAPLTVAKVAAVALFVFALGLGIVRRRFWCRHLCPTGALFSLIGRFSLFRRKVTADCVSCGKCAEACSFGAVMPDFTTHRADCAICRTCAGVCPTGAIAFTARGAGRVAGRGDAVSTGERVAESWVGLSRRGILVSSAAAGAWALGVGRTEAAGGRGWPVRPPGSVPEDRFLSSCVACGECMKVCPTGVLRPMGLGGGLGGLWTPQVATRWSGCSAECGNCTQVCPTGAIRAIDLEEKKAVRIGLAEVNEKTCLPHAGIGECRVCEEACAAADHHAIRLVPVGGKLDAEGHPIEGSGLLAPVIVGQECVGCGFCQARCRSEVCAAGRLPGKEAIEVLAGPGKEDRLVTGSYIALRRAEADEERKLKQPVEHDSADDAYLPDFLQ